MNNFKTSIKSFRLGIMFKVENATRIFEPIRIQVLKNDFSNAIVVIESNSYSIGCER